MATEETPRALTVELTTPVIQPRPSSIPPPAGNNFAYIGIGQLLGGRYCIETVLGEGGMGIVYLAADQQVAGEKFAVKVLKEAAMPSTLDELREEVRKARGLSHPNIVDVHSVNLDGSRLYVLMEYLQGKSLDTLLDEDFGRGIPFTRAWYVIQDVGAALAHAHDHSVIHCDLKPSNVFVTMSGRTKLLDFGIARVSRGKRMQTDTKPCGLTPAYASCEMLEGKDADRRADIYSFACLIYEVLCGEHPFGGLSALEAQRAALKFVPIKSLSRTQNNTLQAALAFERNNRTASVELLLAGLRPDRQFRVSRIAALSSAALAAIAVTYLALHSGVVRRIQNALVEQSPSSVEKTVLHNSEVTVSALPNSIAVLPFLNISGDYSQDYFSDGLSEELIERLVHGTDLRVTARTSSFQFRGKNADARSIARTLNVAHLLEGSVRKYGEHMRISAQLVRGSDGTQIWSEAYDRNVGDIFTVQDEIAEKVARALSVALRDDHSITQGQPDIRAYNLVLEGNFFKARRTKRDVQRAARLYQQAIAVTPNYALAWARLASAYLVEEILNGLPSDEQSRLILAALDRAIRLDPQLVWAYYTRAGFEFNVSWDWAAGQADVKRMRDIDPRFEVLPRAFGDLALTFGNASEAITLYKEHLERSPLDPYTMDSLCSALCAANRLPECLATRLRLLQLHPEYGGINRAVGLARLYLGQLDQALAAMQKEPQEDYRLAGLAIVYAAMGRRAASNSMLEALVSKFAEKDTYEIAEVHAYRGEIAEAFRWLDRAYRTHSFAMVSVKTDPLLRKLQNDSRFPVLLTRMRLNEVTAAVDAQM